MRIAAVILAVILAGIVAAASGDEVTVGRLLYSGVEVVDVKGCCVFFRTSASTVVAKELSKVAHLQIDRLPQLNLAEDLMLKGSAVEAVAAYDKASSAAVEAWAERLVAHRLLRALDEAAMIVRACEEWLTIVEINDASEAALKLRPKRLSEKSAENRKAIHLLEVRVKSVADVGYALAVKELMMKLYRKEQMNAKAAALARQLSLQPAAVRDRATPPSFGRQVHLRAQLAAAGVLIEQGKPNEALASIRESLRRFSETELAEALLLAGRAQWMLASQTQDSEKRREMLLAAGLDFMRMAVFFPARPEAAEALFWAGRVSAAIGNLKAAAKAYTQVVQRYKDSGFSEQARVQLAALGQKAKPPAGPGAEAAGEPQGGRIDEKAN